MSFLYIIPAALLTVFFFMNIKSAADLLCRMVGGFALLIIYNSFAPSLSLAPVGINAASAFICGIMGIPGWVLLLCLNLFL